MAESFRPRWNNKVISYLKKLKSLKVDDQLYVLGNALKTYQQEVNKTVFESKEDEATLESLESRRVKTLEDLIEVANINLDKWFVDRYITNSWEVTSWKQGFPETKTNYQVKAWLNPNQPAIDQDYLRKEIFSELRKKSPTVKYKHGENKGGVILEINIPDLHLGKLAWKDEVGEDYNIKIAKELYSNTFDKLIERALKQNFEIEKVLVIVGSDFYNVDSLYDETTKGTPQDEDGRWQKTFRLGVELMKSKIEEVSEVAPVTAVVIGGNHDRQRSFYLGECLYNYFYGNANVEVDNSPQSRKFYKFGDCGICFAHGDKIGDKNWNQVFAAQAPEIWGKTKYREVHVGDKHHLAKKNQNVIIKDYDENREYKGCTFRITRSLTSLDDYHYSNGYIGTIRGAEAFIWDKKEGVIGTIAVNL